MFNAIDYEESLGSKGSKQHDETINKSIEMMN